MFHFYFITFNIIVSFAALVALSYLNLNRCSISDVGCEKFSSEWHFNDPLDCLFVRFKLEICHFSYFLLLNGNPAYCLNFISPGLKNLKALNMGFNTITDACLVHLKGFFSLSLSLILFLAVIAY